MKKFILNIITLFFILFTGSSLASPHLVDANILYTVPDAGNDSDFHTGKIINLNYNYYVKPWLAITGGFFFSEEIFSDTQSDVFSKYQSSIQTDGVTLGLRPEYKFSERNKIYGRLGLLLYNTKVTIEDQLTPSTAIQKDSHETDGSGYFISLAWAHSFTNSIGFQLELYNQTQLDLFEGQSTSGIFDLTSTGFSLGLSYAF